MVLFHSVRGLSEVLPILFVVWHTDYTVTIHGYSKYHV